MCRDSDNSKKRKLACCESKPASLKLNTRISAANWNWNSSGKFDHSSASGYKTMLNRARHSRPSCRTVNAQQFKNESLNKYRLLHRFVQCMMIWILTGLLITIVLVLGLYCCTFYTLRWRPAGYWDWCVEMGWRLSHDACVSCRRNQSMNTQAAVAAADVFSLLFSRLVLRLHRYTHAT